MVFFFVWFSWNFVFQKNWGHCVRCQLSHVKYHMSSVIFFFTKRWSVEALLSMGPTPSSFLISPHVKTDFLVFPGEADLAALGLCSHQRRFWPDEGKVQEVKLWETSWLESKSSQPEASLVQTYFYDKDFRSRISFVLLTVLWSKYKEVFWSLCFQHRIKQLE